MDKIIDRINFLYESLVDNNLIKELTEIIGYSDEPSIYSFTLLLNSGKKYSDAQTWSSNSSGFSFESREEALIKCLAEAVERLASTSYKKCYLIRSSYNNLVVNALDPSLFSNNSDDRQKKLYWIKGFDLFRNEEIQMPAQTTFFNYKLSGEPHLTELISTGAAAGFGIENAILSGLYEVIERDAFMLNYLLKSYRFRVKTSCLQGRVQRVKDDVERYNLEWCLFDITNDFEIPTMMSLLIDRTGLGPLISVGLKTSLNVEEAVIGSVQESIHSRFWIKSELIKRNFKVPVIKQQEIKSLLQRGLYWAGQRTLDSLSFLLDAKERNIDYSYKNYSREEQLRILICKIKQKNKKVYITDITHPIFRDTGFKVIKIVSPDFQPMYLNQQNLKPHPVRVLDFKQYFNLQEKQYNSVPHPFL